jgi:hypothetical protein
MMFNAKTVTKLALHCTARFVANHNPAAMQNKRCEDSLKMHLLMIACAHVV